MVNPKNSSSQQLIRHRALLIHEEISNARALFERLGESYPGLSDSPWLLVLERLYAEEYPLAKVLDESELIAFAEGPALHAENPRLDIVTWLCNGIQSQTRALTASSLNLGARSRAIQSLQFRLTGLAPGSLYVGFSIVDDGPITTVTDTALADGEMGEAQPSINILNVAQDSIVNLTKVSAHANELSLSESLGEEIADPAQRDASLMAALKLSPTGRNGVTSIQFHSRFSGRSETKGMLDVSNRGVIQDTLKNRPLIAKAKKQGAFIGQLRALDLDKTRVDLRGVEDVGHLRCIVSLDVGQAQKVLGQWVKVSGEYETNSSGRPRLLVAQNIEVVREPSLAAQLKH